MANTQLAPLRWPNPVDYGAFRGWDDDHLEYLVEGCEPELEAEHTSKEDDLGYWGDCPAYPAGFVHAHEGAYNDLCEHDQQVSSCLYVFSHLQNMKIIPT